MARPARRIGRGCRGGEEKRISSHPLAFVYALCEVSRPDEAVSMVVGMRVVWPGRAVATVSCSRRYGECKRRDTTATMTGIPETRHACVEVNRLLAHGRWGP